MTVTRTVTAAGYSGIGDANVSDIPAEISEFLVNSLESHFAGCVCVTLLSLGETGGYREW